MLKLVWTKPLSRLIRPTKILKNNSGISCYWSNLSVNLDLFRITNNLYSNNCGKGIFSKFGVRWDELECSMTGRLFRSEKIDAARNGNPFKDQFYSRWAVSFIQIWHKLIFIENILINVLAIIDIAGRNFSMLIVHLNLWLILKLMDQLWSWYDTDLTVS